MQLYGFCQEVLNKVLYREALPLGPIPSQLSFFCQKRYHISSNNSRPLIYRLPRIITPFWWKYLKQLAPLNNAPPTPLSIFSFFYPLLVKLRWNLIQQNWLVTIQALKMNHGTKFGKLKKPILSLFDVIIFYLLGWYNKIFRAQLAVSKYLK